MSLDIVKSGPVILPANSKGNVILGPHAWDFLGVDPADDNIICEVQTLDGKAEFQILGSLDEEAFPGAGLGPVGEWGVIHGDIRLTASSGESFSNTYTKHPFMVVLASNPTPNPVTVQAIFYGRDSLGSASSLDAEITVVKSADAKTNSLTISNITPMSECDYLITAAMNDDSQITGITGFGLTWSLVKRQANSNKASASIWKGTGAITPGPSQNVVISFSNTKEVVAALLCVKRADPVTPYGASVGVNGNSVPLLVPSVPTTANGLLLGVIGSKEDEVFTPGNGFTPLLSRSRSDKATLHLLWKASQAGSDDVEGTFANGKEWAAIGIGINRE